jgi:hypothetical protein
VRMWLVGGVFYHARRMRAQRPSPRVRGEGRHGTAENPDSAG